MSVRCLLDTDICIELLRGRAAAVYRKLRRQPLDSVGLSAITWAELQYGAARSARPNYHQELLTQFCAPLALLPFDTDAAMTYGRVRAELAAAGTPIGPLDMLIAAHALARDAILITNNEREFGRVAGLKVENWLGE